MRNGADDEETRSVAAELRRLARKLKRRDVKGVPDRAANDPQSPPSDGEPTSQASRLAVIGQKTACLARESRGALQRIQSGITLLGYRLRGRADELLLLAINKERLVPVVLITAHHESDFLANGAHAYVMAYLSKPIKPVDLMAAVNLAAVRIEQFRQLQSETNNLRQALEDRKVIERAKGVVMKRLRVDEEDAYRRLRKVASDHNQKLIEVAHRVVSADDPFHQLERC